MDGICTISQGDFYLTEHNGKAVTTIAGSQDLQWRITNHPNASDSPQIIIALTHGPLGEASGVVNVLTLGKKTEEEGIQIYLQPLQNPPPKSQLWTLEHILATKRFPPLMMAQIQSVEYPNLSAGTGFLNIPLPRIFMNVAAGALGEENEKWKFDYTLP